MQRPFRDVEEILEGIEGLLFLDNAYVEFSGIDYLPLMKRHENLVLGRTFSKVHSLAGLRIGYAFTPRWLPPWYRGPAPRSRSIRSLPRQQQQRSATRATRNASSRMSGVAQTVRYRSEIPGPAIRRELRHDRCRSPHG